MALASKTFRIIVSSTFTDLKAERNALQGKVFPRLRELCMHHGCRFQAIDLRWGIREEAALDQQTMNIYMQELKHWQKISPLVLTLSQSPSWTNLKKHLRGS
jgi:hypothetical protein